MKKNRLIGFIIIALMFTFPFHYTYIDIEGYGGIGQALSMAVLIIGVVVGIVMINNSSEEAHH